MRQSLFDEMYNLAGGMRRAVNVTKVVNNELKYLGNAISSRRYCKELYLNASNASLGKVAPILSVLRSMGPDVDES
jgi:hypothetical protein